AAEPERGVVRELVSGDQFGGDWFGAVGAATHGPGDCAIRAHQGARVREVERAEDTHRIGVTASRGDDDLDSGGLGGEEGGKITGADLAVIVGECAVDVDDDHADVRCWLQVPPSGVTSWLTGLSVLSVRLRWKLPSAKSLSS